mmetsp:Transcript_22035/g.31000  ORF Transcript_22035/g.31000 Transcript_22035/m.31000 type:complete len:291 (-) Transcript_22035:164-1036(-)
MAAVLCRGVGQLCKGLGEVVCLPCKACGIGCEAIWNAVKSPFLPYLLVTIGLNLPPVSMGVRSIPELFVGEEGCSEEGPLWLIVNMALATIHILAAFYLSRKISQEEDYASSVNATTTNTTASNAPTPVMATMTTTPTPVPQASAVVYGETTESKIETGMSDKLEVSATAPVEEPTTPSSNSNKTSTPKVAQTQPKNKNNNLTGTPHNTMSRVRHMLCEDKWMALYILIGIGWILWQIIGVQRFFALDDAEDACSNVRGFIATSLACGWLYFFLAGIAFGISLCCLGLSS